MGVRKGSITVLVRVWGSGSYGFKDSSIEGLWRNAGSPAYSPSIFTCPGLWTAITAKEVGTLQPQLRWTLQYAWADPIQRWWSLR